MSNVTEKMMNDCEELRSSGATKAKVESFLMYMHDKSVNEAKAIAKKVWEDAGYSSNQYGRADHEVTVKYLRENYGKIDKKELINGMCEVNGKTYLTNQHAYNYITMMIEWAKQELEANS